MFKQFLTGLGCAAILAACSPADGHSQNAVKQSEGGVQVNMPTARGEVNFSAVPKNIAVFDLSSLDTLTALGVKAGGTPKKVHIPYLQAAIRDTANVGTLFEPDYEALHALHPDLIIISHRTAPKFDELIKIAPTIDVTANSNGIVDNAFHLIDNYGKLFGKQAEAEKLHANLQQLINETVALAKNKGNGLMILVNGDKMAAFGPDSRFGWIHTNLGFPMADANINSKGHGQSVSFEYLQKTNPDWLFVMDRGAAIGQEGKSAQVLLDNPLVRQTKAWKNGHVVYLSSASYLASGGVQQLQTDIGKIKEALNK
ncbi:siderophore ABC transporter substrate-binding protein [Stenoxybacter acetivorans]|uniref:siderophore ABC transporter substrate-binding protein n=1 Tax=Stenoxybacter acetivorans TaxID=422441 RepID=UPI0009FBEFEF|nr:siderophore ABC transporter substrate-binding protein [Stenoxybacter acetivorans]